MSRDEAVAAFNRIGHGLEMLAAVGMIYLASKLWTSNNISIPSIFTKRKESLICGDCNEKAVCSTCTQKVCAVCKLKPRSV